jgi:hypothetical protein
LLDLTACNALSGDVSIITQIARNTIDASHQPINEVSISTSNLRGVAAESPSLGADEPPGDSVERAVTPDFQERHHPATWSGSQRLRFVDWPTIGVSHNADQLLGPERCSPSGWGETNAH